MKRGASYEGSFFVYRQLFSQYSARGVFSMSTPESMAGRDPESPQRPKMQPKSTRPNRRPLILMLLILSLLFVASYTGRLGSLAGIRGEIAQKEQQIADARQRQAALLDEQRYVDSKGYLDDVARGEMGMGQRDEAAVVVVKEHGLESNSVGTENSTTLAAGDETEVATIPIWQQWLTLFAQQQG
jgi:hypothetical protein